MDCEKIACESAGFRILSFPFQVIVHAKCTVTIHCHFQQQKFLNVDKNPVFRPELTLIEHRHYVRRLFLENLKCLARNLMKFNAQTAEISALECSAGLRGEVQRCVGLIVIKSAREAPGR